MKTVCTVIIIHFFLGLPAFARIQIIPPETEHPTAYAILVDRETFALAKNELLAYKAAAEKEGLSTYLVEGLFESPEEVRAMLIKLHEKKPPLEGAVLVGTIPVAMIRNGQHLTSAFKMDQEKFPRRRSSVPSDRFYDDFDLKFEFLGRDNDEPHLFYYALQPDSTQKVRKEIYSARIFPPEKGPAGTARIKEYLERRVRQMKNPKHLRRAMSVTGHGYRSECLNAWKWEQLILREQLPQLFRPGGWISTYFHSMSPELETILYQELQEASLQLALFHAHGDPRTQFILGSPRARSMKDHMEAIRLSLRNRLRRDKERERSPAETQVKLMKEMDIPLSWFDGAFDEEVTIKDEALEAKQEITVEEVLKIVPRARLVFFDECFNGRFIDQPCIAAQYLYTGDTAAAVANTVNVLQDIHAHEFIGLLSHGLRLGQYHKMQNFSESHILGDPLLRFEPEGDLDLSKEMEKALTPEGLLRLLESREAPLRGLAVYSLGFMDGPTVVDELIEIYRSETSGLVRMEAFRAVARLRPEALETFVLEALLDPYELIRRKSVSLMGDMGLEQYALPLVKAVVLDPSRRTSFNARRALQKLDPEALKKGLQAFLKQYMHLLPQEASFRKELERIVTPPSWLEENMALAGNREGELQKRIQSVRSFRNYRIHRCVPQLLEVALRADEDPLLKVTILEALGWFTYSYQRERILQTLEEVLASEKLPDTVRGEALKTKKRLLAGSNEPLCP